MRSWIVIGLLGVSVVACGNSTHSGSTSQATDSASPTVTNSNQETDSASTEAQALSRAPATLAEFCSAIDVRSLAAATGITDDSPSFSSSTMEPHWNCDWSQGGRAFSFSASTHPMTDSDSDLKSACSVVHATKVQLLSSGGHRGVACFGGAPSDQVIFAILPDLGIAGYTAAGVGDAGDRALIAATSRLASRYP